jgi:hypothetical protein
MNPLGFYLINLKPRSMKKTFQFVFGTIVSILIIPSCQRNSLAETFVEKNNKSAAIAEQPAALARSSSPQGVCNPNAYTITLESHVQINGNWEWIWSVQNPNPGNGKNGTVQNLSHWGMQLGTCVNWSSVVGAAYSSNGSTWIDFTPSYQSDPSQGCMTTPVLKFDFGTAGSAKTYYRLVVNQNFTEGPVQGYYKSGVNTGCCTFTFTGISGCGGPIEIEVVE